MDLTLLGTGAPLHPDRAMTGMILTAPGCAPLLVDTCGGFELARQLSLVGFDRDDPATLSSRTAISTIPADARLVLGAYPSRDLLLARYP